jgi:ABC-type nitrate/sulfonate/bicarbonate transport system permease component
LFEGRHEAGVQSDHGIGYQTIVGAKRMDITGVLGGLSLLGLLGVTLEQGLAAAERAFAPWRLAP